MLDSSKLKLAAVQAAPVFLDACGTVLPVGPFLGDQVLEPMVVAEWSVPRVNVGWDG